MKKEVFLVEDHVFARDALIAAINTHPKLEICGSNGGGRGTIEIINKVSPDLVLVNLSLHEFSALSLIQRIYSEVGVSILTYSLCGVDAAHAERAILAGARGYVNRTDSLSLLFKAILTAVNGHSTFQPDVPQRILRHNKSFLRHPIHLLSIRELEIFDLIGLGYGSKKISTRLNISMKTLDTYRSRIRIKLNITKSDELLRHAMTYVHDRWGMPKLPEELLQPSSHIKDAGETQRSLPVGTYA